MYTCIRIIYIYIYTCISICYYIILNCIILYCTILYYDYY